jgi:predicted DNA-binding ribbon-helix-helix protein
MGRQKRSVIIAGHKTSISREDEFWFALRDIAAARHWTLSKLLASISPDRPGGNLSSAIRVFIFNHHRAGGSSQRAKETASAVTPGNSAALLCRPVG